MFVHHKYPLQIYMKAGKSHWYDILNNPRMWSMSKQGCENNLKHVMQI